MKKLIAPILLAFFMLGLLGCGGCSEDFDWKDAAKKIVVEWVKDKVIVALDQFGDQKDSAVGWCAEQINKSDKLAPYLKWIDIESVVGVAWDYVTENVYTVARNAGMDVDADDPGLYSWHLSGADFPGADEKMMVVME